MNAQELRQLSPNALRAKATELRVEVIHGAYAEFQGKEKNVKKRRHVRHELACVLTIISEREKKPSPLSPLP